MSVFTIHWADFIGGAVVAVVFCVAFIGWINI